MAAQAEGGGAGVAGETGIYSLDLAEGIEVAVVIPKAMNRLAQSLRRSKTDRADAQALHPSDEELSPAPGACRVQPEDAVCSLARKLLHAIYGVFKSQTLPTEKA